MEKFVPYEKLSNKKKRELDRRRRNTWGSLNPVTRNTANPKAYDRRKARKRDRDDLTAVPSVFSGSRSSGKKKSGETSVLRGAVKYVTITPFISYYDPCETRGCDRYDKIG